MRGGPRIIAEFSALFLPRMRISERGARATHWGRALKSGEGLLDDNLVKALQGDRFPNIRFEASHFTSKALGASKFSVDAIGRLTIAGAEHAATVHATVTTAGKSLHVVGSKAIVMSSFGIAPPVLFGGMVRCSDQIEVSFDLMASLADQP